MKTAPSLGVLIAVLVAARAGAQSVRPLAHADVVTVRVRSESSAGTDQLTGSSIRGTGALALGRFHLLASYLQGSLQPDGGTAASRDMAEGTVFLGYTPLTWLTLEAGPHARAYTLSGGTSTQRWLYWELRARAAGAFVGSAVHGYAELWRALGGDANVPESFDHAEGGEAGMIVHLARSPLEGRLAYRIDHSVLGGGARTETVDGVIIGIGVSWR